MNASTSAGIIPRTKQKRNLKDAYAEVLDAARFLAECLAPGQRHPKVHLNYLRLHFALKPAKALKPNSSATEVLDAVAGMLTELGLDFTRSPPRPDDVPDHKLFEGVDK